MMRLSEAAAMLGVPFAGADAEGRRVCTDSRSIQPGDLFIALAGNAVLHRLTAADHAAVSREGGRRYCEFLYQSETWDHPRHVIASTFQRGTETIRQHFVVTNIPIAEEQLYTWYCHRAEGIENRIKEWKGHIAADRTSCHDFVANQFRVLLSAAAYILLDSLRRDTLSGTELAHAQVDTIRLKLLKIGGAGGLFGAADRDPSGPRLSAPGPVRPHPEPSAYSTGTLLGLGLMGTPSRRPLGERGKYAPYTRQADYLRTHHIHNSPSPQNPPPPVKYAG